MTQNNLKLHLSWLIKANPIAPVGASLETRFTPTIDSTASSAGFAQRSFPSQQEPANEPEDQPSQSQAAPSTSVFSEFAVPRIPPVAVARNQSTRVLRSNSEEGMARLLPASSTKKSKLLSQGSKNLQLATPASTTNSLFATYNGSLNPSGMSLYSFRLII